ncbi:hypothetical protein BU16DRAFT_261870 [Lophium mytilinum]|uniref:Uncharacterized protein n=1 Tax=Lophium mytilinum TaxID=390894 RepID=A0A6A6R318_9PEZI|nr:hypothetical protein BU16DRAFT_261870 [Lophium mytilinum]
MQQLQYPRNPSIKHRLQSSLQAKEIASKPKKSNIHAMARIPKKHYSPVSPPSPCPSRAIHPSKHNLIPKENTPKQQYKCSRYTTV